MLGGYQILDLRNIDLSRSASESSISDASVLAQLLNIRDHIQKTYDFSKPLHAQLKPLLIRYRDKKVGEKHEVALYGNIEVINTYYKFRIIANNEGEQLTINVEFEEKTDEYDNKYWDIKTAKILLTSEVAIFENITDKDGHKRFIEGEGTLREIEGLSASFNKYSLSGSHLMLVIAGEFKAGTYSGAITTFTLPKWIYDKIVPAIGGNYIALEGKQFYNDLTAQTVTIQLTKVPDSTDIRISLGSSTTFANDKLFRIAFDLLIDNESQD